MVELLLCFELPELPPFLVAVIKSTKCLLKTHSAQGPISGANGCREQIHLSLWEISLGVIPSFSTTVVQSGSHTADGQSPDQESRLYRQLKIQYSHPTAQRRRKAAVVRQHPPKAPGSWAANVSVSQDLPHRCGLCLLALVWRGDQWVFIISLLTAFLTWSKHSELLITERVIYFRFLGHLFSLLKERNMTALCYSCQMQSLLSFEIWIWHPSRLYPVLIQVLKPLFRLGRVRLTGRASCKNGKVRGQGAFLLRGCRGGYFTLAELLSAFPWPTFLLEPSQQCNISSHEYIICANLTVLLLTVLFVLHSPAVVQNQIQHLWACSVVVQQLKGPLPVSLEGTLSSVARHLTSWLPPL